MALPVKPRELFGNSTSKLAIKKTLSFLMLGFLVGCANSYSRHYSGVQDARIIPGYTIASHPLIIEWRDSDNESTVEYWERGYFYIGESGFITGADAFREELLREHARNIGAHIVLIDKKPYGRLEFPNIEAVSKTGNIQFGKPYLSVNRADYLVRYYAQIRSGFGAYIDRTWMESKGWNSGPGAVVAAVAIESPAYTGGLRRGDVIIKANNNPIDSDDHFFAFLRDHWNDLRKVTVLRDKKEFVLDINLAADGSW